jgi:DNA-binding response OmpR family regulator
MSSAETPAVLVLDDQPAMCRLLDRLLRLHGFTSLPAVNAAAAMATAGEHRVDAFILDLTLGDQSGLEVLTWLRRHPWYRLTPVFILTGAPEINEADRTLIKHHWAFVFHKGHSLQVLVEYIRRVLGGLNRSRETPQPAVL